MVNRKFIVFISSVLVSGLLGAWPVWAYDDGTTHRAITQEAIKLFELYNPNQKFLNFEKNLIIQGSEDEDAAPRWLNHFYDPVHNRGFKGGRSSKSWAQDAKAQAFHLNGGWLRDYFSSPNDFSWPRAIYEYAWGDKERGLLSLGHILHLIQDATVPDHTRDDAHVSKKTYEKYAERFTTNNFRLAGKLFAAGQKPIRLGTLDEYFDKLAAFSNGNFFSDDTILDKYFPGPKIRGQQSLRLSDKRAHSFGIGELQDVKIVEIKKEINFWEGKLIEIYFLNDHDNLIVSDYWKHLSEKAVLGSAGVIELFFKEVAAEKESRYLFNLNKSRLKRFLERLSSVIENVIKNILASLSFLNFWSASLDVSDIYTPRTKASYLSNSPSGQDSALPPNPNKSVFGLGTETRQTEISRLMGEALFLQKQLKDYQTRLAQGEVGKNQTLERGEVEEVVKESRRVYARASSLSSSLGSFGGPGPVADDLADLEDNEIPIVISQPTILSPTDFSKVFSTTTISFFGTTTPGLTVFCDFGHNNVVLSHQETGEWSLDIADLPQGVTTFNFFSRDAESRLSEPLAVTVTVDSLPPTINLSVAECADSFIPERCLIPKTEEINVSWSTVDGGNYSYKLLNTYEYWEDEGEVVEVLLAETDDVKATVLTDTLFVTPFGWRLVVVAQTEEGTEIQSEPVEIWFSDCPIVINEIGWTGTTASSTDEWLELYNPLPFELGLDNFWLVGLDNQPLIELSGVIGARGFYLIERGDDGVISDLAADLVADFVKEATAEGLPDNNLQLWLIKKDGEQEVIWDQTILFVPDDYWPEGSIERHWYGDGSEQSSWGGINTDWRQNGYDRDGNLIMGTPLMENSFLTVVPI